MCKLFRLGHRIMKINNITPGLLRFQNHSCCFSNHSFLYSVKCSPNGMAPVPVIFLVASSDTLYACQLSLNSSILSGLNTMLSVVCSEGCISINATNTRGPFLSNMSTCWLQLSSEAI